MATEQTISVFRGEQVTLNFSMAPPTDITGWTLVFTVAKKSNSPTKIIPVQAAAIIDPMTGTFKFNLSEEQTDLAPFSYFWDVWRNDEGFEQVLAYGAFVVAGAARTPPVS